MESQLHRHHEDDSQRIVEGEGEHHKEKKSVIKKVKEKAKKIKNTITKHGHGHKQGNEQGQVGVEPREGKYEQQRHDQKGAEDKEVEVEDETVNDPEIHGAPIYESTVIRSVYLPEEANINKEINAPFDTTKSDVDAATKLDHSKDRKQLIERHELEPEETKRVAFEQPLIFSKDSAVSEEPEPGQESIVEPENVLPQETANVNTATTTEPESEARHEKPITETVSEYAQKIAEKLKPGEDDKALSEAVTDTLQKTTEGIHLTSKTEQEEGPPCLAGKVTESEEVRARLGPVEESKREGEDAFESGLESSGDTVVDRVKDAIGSWLGKSEGTRTAQESLCESYANNGGRGGGIGGVAGGDSGGQR